MKPKKGNWIVRVKCAVEKELMCEDCTEQQAKDTPYSYCVDERETHQTDYTVTSVEENV